MDGTGVELRLRGTCSTCDREYALRKDGRVRNHRSWGENCTGSYLFPQETEDVVKEARLLKPNTPYERYEDMSPKGKLGVMLQPDGDVILTIRDQEQHSILRGASVEFCFPGVGGGQSPRVRSALLNLALAIKRDNEDQPQYRS